MPDPPGPTQDWRPVPDPTLLTTAQLLRELSALRELLEARLDGMDQVTSLLSETVSRIPGAIQDEAGHLREVARERFASIESRFTERDKRAELASRAARDTAGSALLATKELVLQQAEAHIQATEKAAAAADKHMDQIGLRIETMREEFDARLVELKERIDRSEPAVAAAALGQAGRRSDATYAQAAEAASSAGARATLGLAIAGLAGLATIILAVLAAIHG